MAVNNQFVNVATYNDAKLGYLVNLNCFVRTLNSKFKDFNDIQKQLGGTVDIALPVRGSVSTGLVVNFQDAEQRFQPLTCDQAANSSHAFTDQDFMFNARDYMDMFGMARASQLSAQVEANVALNAVSAVPVMSVVNGQSIPTGALHTESGPFRFYGDGTTAINSFTQLAKMEAQFRTYGAAPGPLDVYLDDFAVVDIIGNGLTNFVPMRNDKLANSWDLGSYKGSNSNYYKSNLLPIHTAGTIGQAATVLTVTSTVTDSTGAITALVCSGAGTDNNAIKSGDLGQFKDKVSSFTDLRYVTFDGHIPSKNPVQIRALADAASSAGNVTISIYPPLVSTPGTTQNINAPVVPGMQLTFLPSHRAGLVVGGKAFYLAMPRLPATTPFPSYTSTHKETGVSLRNYYGTRYGQNQTGYVTDCIWASTVVPEDCMRIIFPLV